MFKSIAEGFRMLFSRDEEQPQEHKKGKIHIVTPDGRVELKADFDNKEDFERIKAFVNNEDVILFSKE